MQYYLKIYIRMLRLRSVFVLEKLAQHFFFYDTPHVFVINITPRNYA